MDDDPAAPDDVALRTLTRQVFGDHGLGRDTAGGRSTVRSIRASNVRDFFGEHYRTGTTTVTVAGDVDHDEVVAAVDAAFADMPAGDGRVAACTPGDPDADVSIDDDSEQVHPAWRSVARLGRP